jgi:hypothetical protein
MTNLKGIYLPTSESSFAMANDECRPVRVLAEEGNGVPAGDRVRVMEADITSRKPCQPKEALKPIYHIFYGLSSFSKAILLNFCIGQQHAEQTAWVSFTAETPRALRNI